VAYGFYPASTYGNTGMFAPAANTVAFATTGGERLRIDSSGTLGLGVTPSAWNASFDGRFQLGAQGVLASTSTSSQIGLNWYYDGAYRYIGTGEASRFYQLGGDFVFQNAASGTAANAFNFTDRMIITTAGSVGIGTSSPSARLDVRSPAGTAANQNLITGSSAAAATFSFGQVGSIQWDTGILASSGNYQIALNGGQTAYDITRSGTSITTHGFYTGGTERCRIDSLGAFLVNTTTATGTANFVVAADTTTRNPMSVVNTKATASTDFSIIFYRAGNIVGSVQTSLTATSYITSSDYRLKEDVQPMVGATDRLMALKPVNFAWKVDGSRVDGFLAHEAQEVVPEAVTGEKDAVDKDGKPEYQGIDQSKLVPLLTAALQEALTEIADLKARVAALEA
jgi:hypothetical protein